MEIGSIPEKGLVGPVNRDGKSKPVQENSTAPKKDSVEISEEARRKMADLADAALRVDRMQTEAGSEKLAEVRKRIDSGFYEQAEIRHQIAEGLLGEFEKKSIKDSS
jgi:anti-sigma28 factor (negative regulator of flagellin synthesis)